MKKRAAAEPDTLERYNAKRDFQKTAEPAGKRAASDDFIFIIQKHEASHLHYDFRLQLDGTLKSWAVPKGPSYDPHDKRLAMQVEDHPVDYATFEGTIPQGEYGGGTVMLWDRGTWEPVGDPRAGLVDGKLVFRLHGERLEGEWTLVRTHGKAGAASRGKADESGRQWLLIKHRDEFVREGDAGQIVAKHVKSVATGRTMAQIAAHRDAPQKTSKAGASQSTAGSAHIAQPEKEKPKKTHANNEQAQMKQSARQAPSLKTVDHKSTERKPAERKNQESKTAAENLPGFIEPQLATLSDAMPTGAGWVHEIKFDGYRMLTYIENGNVRMISRNKKDWTESFAAVAEFASKLPVANAIIDGEVVCMDGEKSDFSSLKDALSDGRSEALQYFAFDVLFLDGVDVRQRPLTERRALLAAVIKKLTGKAKRVIQLSAEFEDTAGTLFENICGMNFEGVISKRGDAPYLSGRGKTWLKTKCSKNEEFVIGGFTPPANGSDGIGALLLGYFDGATLHYAGRVGTGWNAKTSESLRKALEKMTAARCPFAAVETAARRNAQWVRPELVCAVQFAEWTPDGHLRHPSFQGLREDKAAREVVRDRAIPVAKAAKAAGAAIEKARVAPAAAKVQQVRSAVAASKASGDATVGGIRISHPDRIIFPETGVTKVQLAEYYLSVADVMIPHIARRPISVLRCPNGAGETGFFQRHLGLGSSPHLREVQVPIKGRDVEYMMIDTVEGLLALVQWGVIEIHPWQCTEKKLDRPDRMIFDLDPAPDVSWQAVMDGAREVRDRMAELGLTSFVKTTGGKGLHIVVPMAPVYDFETIKSFSHLIAQSMEADSPKKYISKMTKAARNGKIFVDYLRNDHTATAVAPFSARARVGGPISRPLSWKDLTAKLDPLAFTVDSPFGSGGKPKGDPWLEFFDLKQRILKKHLSALQISVQS